MAGGIKILTLSEVTTPVAGMAIGIADSATTNVYITIANLQKLWVTDVDAGNNSLINLDLLEFGENADTPTASLATLFWTAAAGLVINVPTGDKIDLSVNGGSEYTFGETEADWNSNSLINVGALKQLIDNTTATFTMEANRTSPANEDIVSQILSVDDNDAGAPIVYGRIRVIDEGPAAGSASGSMKFGVSFFASVFDIMTLNLDGSGKIGINGTLRLTNNGIIEWPTSGQNIEDNGGFGIDMNMQSSGSFGIKHGGPSVKTYSFSETQFDMTDNLIIWDATGYQHRISATTTSLTMRTGATGDSLVLQTGTTTRISINGSANIDFLLPIDMNGNEIIDVKNLEYDLTTATTALSFANNELQEISISANTTFTGTSYVIGRTKVLKITTDGSTRTLDFPSGWVFVGTKPTDQAPNKTGILSLTCFTAAEAGVVASYAVEA